MKKIINDFEGDIIATSISSIYSVFFIKNEVEKCLSYYFLQLNSEIIHRTHYYALKNTQDGKKKFEICIYKPIDSNFIYI